MYESLVSMKSYTLNVMEGKFHKDMLQNHGTDNHLMIENVCFLLGT